MEEDKLQYQHEERSGEPERRKTSIYIKKMGMFRSRMEDTEKVPEKKLCPLLEDLFDKECYCVKLDIQTIPDAMHFCSGGHYSDLRFVIFERRCVMRIVLAVLFLGLVSFEVLGGTKEFCADRWPGDLKKQEQCRKDQAKAHAEINKMADAHGLLNSKGQIYVEATGGDIEKVFYEQMKNGQRPEFGTFNFQLVLLYLDTLLWVPDDILNEIKMRNKDQKSTMDQIMGYHYLQRYKPSNIPENVIRVMKRDASQRHPYNYIRQAAVFKKKVLSYYSIHNLSPAEDSIAYGERIMRSGIKLREKGKVQAKRKEALDQLKNRTEEIVYTFSGTHGKVTEVFEVSPYWLIKYRNQTNGYFTIKLYSESGKYIDLVTNSTELEFGVEYKNGGRYYLEVESKGNWDVKVIEIELVDGRRTKTHHEYIKEGWEEKRPLPHD